MALQDLVGSECGRTNPLTQLTSHFLLDQTHEEHGLMHSNSGAGTDELVQEYLEEFYGQKTQSFCMDSLFEEMTKIESMDFPPVPTPEEPVDPNNSDVGALDSAWVQEYLGTRKPFNEDSHEEEIWTVPSYRPDISPIGSIFHNGFDSIWTPSHYEPDERNIDVDENWLQESEVDEERQSSLQELAKMFINSVDDPKLKGSKFMKFMQLVGNGDVSITGGQVTEHVKPDPCDGDVINIKEEEEKTTTANNNNNNNSNENGTSLCSSYATKS